MPRDDEYAAFNFVGQTVTLLMSARHTFQQLKEMLAPSIGIQKYEKY